jgi:hypothetical protein
MLQRLSIEPQLLFAFDGNIGGEPSYQHITVDPGREETPAIA